MGVERKGIQPHRGPQRVVWAPGVLDDWVCWVSALGAHCDPPGGAGSHLQEVCCDESGCRPDLPWTEPESGSGGQHPQAVGKAP